MKTVYFLILATVLCAGNVFAMGNRGGDSSQQQDSSEAPSTVSEGAQQAGQDAKEVGQDMREDAQQAGDELKQDAERTSDGVQSTIPGSAATEDQRPGGMSDPSLQEDPALRPAGTNQ